MKTKLTHTLLATVMAATAFGAEADAVTDWNLKTAQFVTDAKMGTPPAVRLTALVQTAAWKAAAAADLNKASAEAAIAAAHRAVLLRLLPAQQAAIEAAYTAALANVAEGPARTAGVTLGHKLAGELLAARLDDGAGTPESYRPHAAAGSYVPTTAVAVPQWAGRKPWAMNSGAQFRPAAPPALNTETWARDFNEIKQVGARNSTKRSPEQTDIARFWDYSLPAIYHGVVRSVALQPGRSLVRNARLFALVAQAMDDSLIAVFDAKYQYNFWRPVTAVRNADIDGNDATARDAGWASLIEAPMHPEYPSGHSILASTMATVVRADLGKEALPMLSTTSPTLNNSTRRWSTLEDFVKEVGDSRVWGGIHYRSAIDTGVAMGRQIGELVVRQAEDAAQP